MVILTGDRSGRLVRSFVMVQQVHENFVRKEREIATCVF
jgi:hypothetical protein